MRKEVKLGLAIGVVFLLVLIAYVLVSPEADRRVVELTESGEPAPVDATASITDPDEPAPEAADPFAAEMPVPSDAVAEAERPLTDSNSPWAGLVPLDDAPPLMTTTPDAAAQEQPSEPQLQQPADTHAAQQPPVVASPQAAVSRPSGPLVSELKTQPEAAPPARLVVQDSSPSAPAPSAAAPAAGARVHVIQRNETLSSIAAAAYGSANYYPHILRANPDLNPERLQIGTKIVLPESSEVRPDGSSVPTRQRQAAADPTAEYRVVSGDSLYRISMKLYRTPKHVDEIYELNKQTIGSDPSRLRTDMVLKLPLPPNATASSR